MRNTFINTLCELAKDHEEIFLLCGDLGYSVLEPFAEQFPDRFLNAGIAEQNMTEVAVGLAREGFNVFTYSIGNFPTLRCMEQIRYDVCYHNANVKIVAVGAGYAYGPQGASHHTTEDFAMLRAIPNMTICAPCDPVEAKAAANFMANHRGPGYVRINKSGEACVHNPSRPIVMLPGQLIPIKPGRGTAVLATGAIVRLVMDEIRNANSDWAVFSAPFVGSYCSAATATLADKFDQIVTVEEHQMNGGFGSSIIEAFSDLYAVGTINRMPRVRRVAIPNVFIDVAGSQEYLRQTAGLSIKQLLG